MKNAPSAHLEFLRKSIKILILDSNPDDLHEILNPLHDNILFDISYANDTKEAENLLNSGKMYHICLSDLNCSSENHDLLFLEKYVSAIDFIFISHKKCLETGYKLYELGAKGVFSRTITNEKKTRIINKIQECFLDSILDPNGDILIDDQVNHWCEVIKKRIPDTVSQWAIEVGVDESYIRRKVNIWFGVSPKNLLMLYKMYSFALELSWDSEIKNLKEKTLFGERFTKLQRYYFKNQSELFKILYNNSPKFN